MRHIINVFVLTALVSLAGCAGVFQRDPYFLPIATSARAPAASDGADPSIRVAQLLVAQMGARSFTDPGYGLGPVREAVLLTFRKEVSSAQVREVLRRLSRLAKDSRRADGRHPLKGIVVASPLWTDDQKPDRSLFYTLYFNSEGDRNFVIGRPIVTDPAFYDPAYAAFQDFVMRLTETHRSYGYRAISLP